MVTTTSEPITQVLKSIALFQYFKDWELEAVANVSTLRAYKRNSQLFCQYEPMDHIYFVINGRIRIYRISKEGKEQTFYIAADGDMFPHEGFFRQGSYTANAAAETESLCLVTALKPFEEILIHNSDMTTKMFQLLTDKIIDLQTRLEEKSCYTLKRQVMASLIRLSSTHSSACEGGWNKFDTRLTNQELAGMVGTTRETVNRCLNELKKHEVVTSNEGHLMIRTERLRQMLHEAGN
ncbi:Crp/Fnr family transcriptional regulator [Paenibacillus apiarius]|uniref:Crp/Fnr family transcriptional regulator n=1 Tax=Paenibacillus apiarius TaxID=46240 RepID=UPI00197D0461|nr:Crp/Fnr family transcriptional regulator [Paenibacillus apiarius]MBN3526599.1 Crp/Fnr family transcriptional regulator [Paenibacillus apiarius]